MSSTDGDRKKGQTGVHLHWTSWRKRVICVMGVIGKTVVDHVGFEQRLGRKVDSLTAGFYTVPDELKHRSVRAEHLRQTVNGKRTI